MRPPQGPTAAPPLANTTASSLRPDSPNCYKFSLGLTTVVVLGDKYIALIDGPHCLGSGQFGGVYKGALLDLESISEHKLPGLFCTSAAARYRERQRQVEEAVGRLLEAESLLAQGTALESGPPADPRNDNPAYKSAMAAAHTLSLARRRTLFPLAVKLSSLRQFSEKERKYLEQVRFPNYFP